MNAIQAPLLLTLLLLLALPSAGAAQEMRMLQGPVQLAADDPRAPVAAGTVQIILTGDVELTLEHVRQHAAPALLASPELEGEVRQIVATLGTGEYLLEELNDAGEMVLARLSHTNGGEPAAILLGFDAAEPHRITQLRTARIQIRRPGG